MQVFHTAATDTMQQIVVNIIDSQVCHRLPVHGNTTLAGLCGRVKVRQFGGYEIFTALMTAESDTCTGLRLSLAIDRRGVKVVDSMFNGIVNLTIYHLLIIVILVFCF